MSKSLCSMILKAALLAGVTGASPAVAVTVVPISGLTHSSTVALAPRIDVATDSDQDAWSSTPADLTTTSVATLLPDPGGVVGSSQTIDATWASSGLSGTMSVVNQALIIAPDDLTYLALSGSASSDIWSYQFHADTDATFTFMLELDTTRSGTGDIGYATFFDDGFYINGAYVSGAVIDGGSDSTGSNYSLAYTYALSAGSDYSASFRFANQHEDTGGTLVANSSQVASWSITDTPTGPGDGGTGGAAVPEPATWAMMIAGLAVVGASLRARRKIATPVFA